MVREVIFKDWCTPCLRESEGADRVESVWQGTVAISGAPPRQLDLCATHYDQFLGGLPQALETFGEQPDSTREAVKATGKPDFRCPICDKPYAYRNSLGSHTVSVHGTTIGELESGKKIDPASVTCDQPGCTFVATAPPGLGAHKRAKHGIEGKSPAAKNWRQENGTPPPRDPAQKALVG